jgi:hypothetical protein
MQITQQHVMPERSNQSSVGMERYRVSTAPYSSFPISAQWSAQDTANYSYPQLHSRLCALLQALMQCSLCTHALSVPVCMQSKSSLSRGSCLGTCCQREVLLKILNLHSTVATCGRAANRLQFMLVCLHLASVACCCSALSICRVEHSKHHHLEC